MDIFLIMFPKAVAILGVLMATFPALCAAHIQGQIMPLTSARFVDRDLNELCARTAKALIDQRDKASTDYSMIVIGLITSIAAIATEAIAQLFL
jgi:uncharacterized protein YejL (UPF0352 family)